jgi:hypothetical protein
MEETLTMDPQYVETRVENLGILSTGDPESENGLVEATSSAYEYVPGADDNAYVISCMMS